jgi:hypothetical protein
MWAATLAWQRRTLSPLADSTRTASDLASARLRGTNGRRGLSTVLGLEITSEGEAERVRQLRFVGGGQGAYDSLGNLVGTGHGDHDLVIGVSGDLQRISRAAASVRLAWQPPGTGAWEGSRAEITLETDARRRGEIELQDALLSAAAARGDPDLSRGAVTQRIEAELAPNARYGSVSLRGERRVSADRSFSNFAQTLDERSGTARWRGRLSAGWTLELEGRLRRADAAQSAGTSSIARIVREGGTVTQLGYTPHARLRVALASDLAWARQEGGQTPWSSTWKVGPDLGLTVLRQGRLELSARRTLSSGEPVSVDLPFGDPLGALRWESSARFDYRLREQTMMGISLVSRDRKGHVPEHEGRAEVRAFF